MTAASTEEKRAAISEAAIKMFARKGYHGTRIADIAREAKVSYGLVYHYFKSKEEIVTFLFQRKWDLLVGVIDSIQREEVGFERQVEAVTSFLIESYRLNPELIEALVMEITRNGKFIKGRNLRLLEKALSGMESMVRSGQARGEVRTGIDPKVVSYAFFGSIESILTGFVFKTLPQDDAAVERAKQGVRDLFIQGLRPIHGDRVLAAQPRSGKRGVSPRGTTFFTNRPRGSFSGLS